MSPWGMHLPTSTSVYQISFFLSHSFSGTWSRHPFPQNTGHHLDALIFPQRDYFSELALKGHQQASHRPCNMLGATTTCIAGDFLFKPEESCQRGEGTHLSAFSHYFPLLVLHPSSVSHLFLFSQNLWPDLSSTCVSFYFYCGSASFFWIVLATNVADSQASCSPPSDRVLSTFSSLCKPLGPSSLIWGPWPYCFFTEITKGIWENFHFHMLPPSTSWALHLPPSPVDGVSESLLKAGPSCMSWIPSVPPVVPGSPVKDQSPGENASSFPILKTKQNQKTTHLHPTSQVLCSQVSPNICRAGDRWRPAHSKFKYQNGINMLTNC